MHVDQLATPALTVDVERLDANIERMAAAWPRTRLRPHVKAFKSTALAARLAAAGHTSFCGATTRELAGLAAAGLGQDLLLANEVVDVERLRDLVRGAPDARITVAVDSAETIDAAARAGVAEVLIDVNVGMPRCGCAPGDAGRLGEAARARGLGVRGVMGYEGHLMTEAVDLETKVASAMETLLGAHDAVGGDVISGGGTGTWRTNRWVTELQAGSYTLMDTHYGEAGVGFDTALALRTTVVSVDAAGGWAVVDGGLKALGMDHGNPRIDHADLWYCADEHTVFSAAAGRSLPAVGDRVTVWPAHVDPTVAYHEALWLVRGDEVIDRWAVDLRGW